MVNTSIQSLLEGVLSGRELSADELYALADAAADPDVAQAVEDAAAELTARNMPRRFDTCSIVNGRSGLCGEDCHWCAQSRRYATGCDVYEEMGRKALVDAARLCGEAGIGRFSIVCSGRALSGRYFAHACEAYADIEHEAPVKTCASLGLISREQMSALRRSGVSRYHCNLETAPSHFGSLCTTHTQAEKMATIEAARAEGLEICSGGIIGMGESRRQRVELALELRKVRPVSIPINILCPIPGTPLEHAAPLSDDEIVLTVALFRLAHPQVTLRFAGGRSRISREGQLRCLRAGINGAIVGDLLTTIGSTVASDRELVAEAGYEF